MLAFRRIDIASSVWAEEMENYEDRTIFQTPAWLSFLADTQNAEPVVAVLKDDGRKLGYFTGLIVRRLGLKILGSPLPGWTTSYMGFNLAAGVPRRLAIQALIHFAFEELGCVHLEIMDRKLMVEDLKQLGFEHRWLASFGIDLTQPEERLFASMSGACRRCIRKAHHSGVIIEEAQDLDFADEYYSQLKDVFRRQSLVPLYGVDRVHELILHLNPTGSLLLLRARDPHGRCIATGIFPAMNGTAYFWGGASWREYQLLRPNEAIHWYAMKYWKQRGMHVYDMGGGGEYKRKYGGSEIRVPWVRISKYPWIPPMRELSRHVVSFRQLSLGKVERVLSKLQLASSNHLTIPESKS